MGFNGPNEHLRVEMPPIKGVRAISPVTPYGIPGFVMDVNRSPEQSTSFPIEMNQQVWVAFGACMCSPTPV